MKDTMPQYAYFCMIAGKDTSGIMTADDLWIVAMIIQNMQSAGAKSTGLIVQAIPNC